ncbi:MAG: DUF1353 domain-containing protein [Proteobacteria bacterium]|nr:DUF1353 domain-containing protein [Pseudomonadota bacterium]MCP4916759.1 DUF1353 domain-containing protein [Pseudomonadota bacterium]
MPRAELTSAPLRTVRLEDGRCELLEDLEIRIDHLIIRVPKGTHTDFSSVPQAFAWFVRWSRVDVAGVVHDHLYQVGGDPSQGLDRERADWLWAIVAMSGQSRANAVQGWVGYVALRLAGRPAWRRLARSR